MKLLITILAGLGASSAFAQDVTTRFVGTTSPYAYLLPQGNILAGGMWDLVYSDNLPLVLRPNLGNAATRLVLEGRLPTDPSALSFTVESHSTAPNVEQVVAMWDYDARTWVTIGADTLWSLDSAREYTVPDQILRFSEAGTGRMRVQIAIRSYGQFAYPWQARIDSVYWSWLE
ncbi:MAG: hypothetical protein M3R13_10150 [Armatimonadota bacterium]|nr:hypothetical protein [Armatimonadota bacterium]